MTPEALIEATCDWGYIPRDVLMSRERTHRVAHIRQIVCYLLRKNTDLSFPEIGRIVNRDHSTVIHACNLIGDWLNLNPAMITTFMQIERAADKHDWSIYRFTASRTRGLSAR